jgi:hypothetical protein
VVSVYDSWYPDKEYDQRTENYFKLLESIFMVQTGDGGWDFVQLTPHQREFHSNDIFLKGMSAKYDMVDKSRNTSFTISSLIRLCMGNYNYRDEIVPLSRINETKVKELIDEAKKIILHMRPVTIELCVGCKRLKKFCECGEVDVVVDYIPFNPKLCKFNATSIEFPDRGVVWQGYPGLSPDSAEVIRGVRTTRCFIDECLPYNVRIQTSKGLKQICSIKKDDLIKTFNVKKQLIEYKKPLGLRKSELKERELIYLSVDKNTYSIKCTPNHPIYNSNFDIVAAKDLKIGDEVICFINKNGNMLSTSQIEKKYKKSAHYNNYKVCKILDKKIVNRKCRVYNLHVEDNNNYMIEGMEVLSHNCNFMRYFEAIYTAMRDSKRGGIVRDGMVDESGVHHQITLGTTIKGHTKYFYWREGIIKKINNKEINNFRHLQWQVFNPQQFNMEEPLSNWEKLITIVPWHLKEGEGGLKEVMNENWHTFLEEYMAVVVPSDTQLYNIGRIQELANSKEWAKGRDILNVEVPPGEYYLGVDPAGSGGHFFATTIWYRSIDEEQLQQIFLEQQKISDLTEREGFIHELIEYFPFTKVRIDGNGLAYQMAQNLKKFYPDTVEVFMGSIRIKTARKQNISLNEYIHTNQLLLINKGLISFLDDDTQYKQYAGWNRNYKAEEGVDIGHCDSTVANGLALLPINWRFAGRGENYAEYKNLVKIKEQEELLSEQDDVLVVQKKVIQTYKDMSLSDKMKFYKKKK